MPPKPKKSDEDLAQQEVLQAVVLADSFASNFRPVTFTQPKVLMPLANVPMIEYTLEFLAAGGVQEIFIFCCAHADAVERYVKESKLVRRLATVRVHVLVSQGLCTSAGDALREVEARGVIKSDFVLVPGDVVANLSLAPLVAAHKARREVDREAVLTTVMARVPAAHRVRRAGEAKLVALSGETGRLIMYDDVGRRDWKHKARLPISLLQEADRLELHADLYDTHIDVCTPELLVLLQDNFDWQDLRRDMLPGILGQFEYLGKTMYTHVLSTDTASEYAARVHDPHTYDVVSRDIIQRWAYPLVPDANLLPDRSYRCYAHTVYKETGVTLARSATLVRDCVVGGGATIGERTTVEASVIGRGCTVGAGVKIVGSYLWEGVTVEDGVTLHGCICGDGVVIKKGAAVPPGCVLSAGVVVGGGVTLPRYARFLAPGEPHEDEDEDDEDDDDDDDDDDEAGADEGGAAAGDSSGAWRRATAAATAQANAANATPLGSDGQGRLWRVVPTPLSIGHERPPAEGPVVGEESEDEEEEMVEADDDVDGFAVEVEDTVHRAVASDHTVDNLALEIKGLKFSHHRTFSDCVLAIVPALLCEEGLASKTKKERVAWLKARTKRWGSLLTKFIQGAVEQKALVEALVDMCGACGLVDVFVHFLNDLYDRDILPQEVILAWADEAEEEEDDGSADARCLANAKDMIEWLREPDDDDDDDDDDDE